MGWTASWPTYVGVGLLRDILGEPPPTNSTGATDASASGRVVTFNGALAFRSKLIHQGPGDRGTTSASLTGNAQRYGRWEFRIWQNVYERAGRDFRMRVELVPEGTAPGACSPESIRVADMALGERSHSVGVRSAQARSEWRFTKTASPARSGLHNIAVEVATEHKGAQFSVDWVRAWTLETGRQARTGKALTTTSYSPTC